MLKLVVRDIKGMQAEIDTLETLKELAFNAIEGMEVDYEGYEGILTAVNAVDNIALVYIQFDDGTSEHVEVDLEDLIAQNS